MILRHVQSTKIGLISLINLQHNHSFYDRKFNYDSHESRSCFGFRAGVFERWFVVFAERQPPVDVARLPQLEPLDLVVQPQIVAEVEEPVVVAARVALEVDPRPEEGRHPAPKFSRKTLARVFA